MSRRDLSYLTDIVEAAKLIRDFVGGIDKKRFDESPLIQSAVMRQIEVMGEASKRLSDEFKAAHPEMPWRQMAGMRDILIHAYDHVDIDEVWNAAIESIPDLLRKIEPLTRSEE